MLGRLFARGFFHIPLRRTGSGHFELHGKLGGRNVPVLLDTGASKTVVDAEAARTIGLALTPLSKKGGGAGRPSSISGQSKMRGSNLKAGP